MDIKASQAIRAQGLSPEAQGRHAYVRGALEDLPGDVAKELLLAALSDLESRDPGRAWQLCVEVRFLQDLWGGWGRPPGAPGLGRLMAVVRRLIAARPRGRGKRKPRPTYHPAVVLGMYNRVLAEVQRARPQDRTQQGRWPDEAALRSVVDRAGLGHHIHGREVSILRDRIQQRRGRRMVPAPSAMALTIVGQAVGLTPEYLKHHLLPTARRRLISLLAAPPSQPGETPSEP